MKWWLRDGDTWIECGPEYEAHYLRGATLLHDDYLIDPRMRRVVHVPTKQRFEVVRVADGALPREAHDCMRRVDLSGWKCRTQFAAILEQAPGRVCAGGGGFRLLRCISAFVAAGISSPSESEEAEESVGPEPPAVVGRAGRTISWRSSSLPRS